MGTRRLPERHEESRGARAHVAGRGLRFAIPSIEERVLMTRFPMLRLSRPLREQIHPGSSGDGALAPKTTGDGGGP
jgi:hypothetical protein